MPGNQHGKNPCNTTKNIVPHEFLSFHLYNPGDDRGKCSYDGQEPCKHNRLSAVLIIKFFCLE